MLKHCNIGKEELGVWKEETMAARRYCYKDVLPFTALVAAETLNVGVNVLFKAATSKGMSYYIFITYSYAIASLFILPLLFIFNRRAVLPPLKFHFISRICLLGVIGLSAQICSYKGIEYSSPTLASAAGNLSPAFTFILAVLFRFLLLFSSIRAQMKDAPLGGKQETAGKRKTSLHRNMARSYCYNDVLPFISMVAMQCFNVGLNIVFKAATLKGMSYYIFITYTYAIGTVLLLPLSFMFPRTTVLPPLKFHIFSRFILLGLIGY
ncbi:Drug/metabolite transporter [Corchorus olitorius]|uniref:WAT1-related protein n=1 Tax=Corchorus olitorius TaxID=93759 RepID=A0A1R3H2F2_9ROSI|nr:Drug/metabolite transporter [Corchorus olitorius]